MCSAAVLPLVCWSTEGERRFSGHSEEESHPPSISLTYICTSPHRNALLQFLLAIADAWLLWGRGRKSDVPTVSQKHVWLCNVLSLLSNSAHWGQSAAFTFTVPTVTDWGKHLPVAGQCSFSPPHNHFKHHVICGTEVHLLKCRMAELWTCSA